ncbi:hypothetical protein LMG23994_06913 [Cupriavidus pinatubonensis]|uniref:Uncharacterized protein n=1 Tax=Cupriavidus pinatubonensis TaxID=248026 RepID=A0ABN7ZNG2_9BURK|nr:hypothetical protein LMG23994_06913 [Cupriavidus pinatubonensis]
MTAAGPMFALAAKCGYYIVSDPQTKEVIAVVEAGDEPEARQFFAAVPLRAE